MCLCMCVQCHVFGSGVVYAPSMSRCCVVCVCAPRGCAVRMSVCALFLFSSSFSFRKDCARHAAQRAFAPRVDRRGAANDSRGAGSAAGFLSPAADALLPGRTDAPRGGEPARLPGWNRQGSAGAWPPANARAAGSAGRELAPDCYSGCSIPAGRPQYRNRCWNQLFG